MKLLLKQAAPAVLVALTLVLTSCSSSGGDSTPDTTTDAGMDTDAGTDAGMGTDAGTDAGMGTDAGTDAGTGTDAGMGTDAGTEPSLAAPEVNGYIVIGSETSDAQGITISSIAYTLDESTNTITAVESFVTDGVSSPGRNLTETYEEGTGSKLSELIAPLSNTDTGFYAYTYNDKGLLIGRTATFTDPDDTNTSTTFEYNESDALISRTTVIVATGEVRNKYEYTVNADGKPLTETSLSGSRYTFEYNMSGQLISRISDFGNRREYSYDDNGNVTAETTYTSDGALGGVISYSYQQTTENVFNDRLRQQRYFP